LFGDAPPAHSVGEEIVDAARLAAVGELDQDLSAGRLLARKPLERTPPGAARTALASSWTPARMADSGICA